MSFESSIFYMTLDVPFKRKIVNNLCREVIEFAAKAIVSGEIVITSYSELKNQTIYQNEYIKRIYIEWSRNNPFVYSSLESSMAFRQEVKNSIGSGTASYELMRIVKFLNYLDSLTPQAVCDLIPNLSGHQLLSFIEE